MKSLFIALRPRRRAWLVALSLLSATGFLSAAGLVALPLGTATANDDSLFRDHVAPVLARRCLSCHDDTESKGGLSLQTSAALQGGDSGELVIPFDAPSSLLLQMITPTNGIADMPQDADPLTAEEIAAIERWIEQGAHWPEGMKIETPAISDLDWWSLHPLTRPALPALAANEAAPQTQTLETLRVRNEIDHFILARLQAEGLNFSPEADRRTLIRRVYFDLIGLPPTPTQVEQFVNDPDPLAYEKLVDTLLDLPRYGEHWARHWLDVVQYGDSHGYDKDKPRPNAWPYRDYVIRAFNQDKPYSQFVQEQIAGDQLWPDTVDGIVATGFLAAGPWDFIGHAEVPESKIDGQVARNLDRDNIVSSVMNTFNSLTVQCARCHNHKFDPVSMEEYYALQAVFAAIDRADREYDPEPQTSHLRLALQTEKRDLLSALQQVNDSIAAQKSPELIALEKQLTQLEATNADSQVPQTPRASAYGYHSQVASRADVIKWVQVDLGQSHPIDHVVLFAADEYGFADFGFPERWKLEAANSADFSDATLLYDATDRKIARPGQHALAIATNGLNARYVRMTATELWNRRQAGMPLSNDWIFALGELAVLAQGKVVPVEQVTSLDSIEAPVRWGQAALIDGIYGTHDLAQRLGASQPSPSNGYHSQFAASADTTKWIQLDLGSSTSFNAIRLVPARPVDWTPDTPGFGFPVRYEIEVDDSADFSNPRLLVDQTQADVINPGDVIVDHQLDDTQGRYLRLTATRLWDRGQNHFALALAEWEVEQAGVNVALNARVDASDSIDSGLWHRNHLVDRFSSRALIQSQADQILSLVKPEALDQQIAELRAQSQLEFDRTIDRSLIEQRDMLATRLAEIETRLASLPARQLVYAGTVHAGSGAFRGRAGLGPREIRVLARGEVTKPGDLVAPGTVALIPGVDDQFDIPADADEGARRVALAQWLTRPDHPLTWRSIVNRVWLYHFGQGIVDSPNDFGRGGQLPTHPELLDWLAVEFRDSSQSLKSLHRLICTSTTYRQASDRHEAGEQIDGGNRLLWRMNRRRLTAEEIHDAVLQLAGRLNLKMGGPGYQDFLIERPEHSPHYEYHKYDPLSPDTHRRSIYRFIVRSQPQPFMNTLDCADPSMSVAKRDETQTALQALALMNNQFMVAMAGEVARQVESESSELETQIEHLWQQAFQRLPTEQERHAVADYARQHGLANACRMLMNVNEFVFVD